MPTYGRHKYKAKPTTVDGIRFDSKAESKRYQALKLLERAGQIKHLELQPVFPLHAPLTPHLVSDVNQLVGRYVADFRYTTKDGAEVVEDVKGMRTAIYKWKKKHVEIEYGIQIVEVKA